MALIYNDVETVATGRLLTDSEPKNIYETSSFNINAQGQMSIGRSVA
jgi:hypothetical protein